MSASEKHFEPSPADISAARARIAPYAVATPVLENEELNRRVGGRVLIKPEILQRSGSFKFRGAINRVLQLTKAEKAGGVVAWSSGNHGLALSYVAKELGIDATILMPQEAPKAKINGVRANGATVRLYDKTKEVREEIGAQIAAETGAVIIPPYDDPYVITGQSTLGAEFSEQAQAMEAPLDAALFSCSGGGLVSGAATGVHAVNPDTEVFSVEPEGFDGMAQSLAAGERVTASPVLTSICDALLVTVPGQHTFPLCQSHLKAGLTVTNDEVIAAIQFAYKNLKLVVEPGGAAALAAVLAGKIETAGRTTGILLSGGNVDPEKYATYLVSELPPAAPNQ
ncbi:threonine ammonia-lyase [Leisingera sp. S232]|uniref:threonine ammonia-lyase n=1 Tax=Leisingera sp. S232 TaxID=3415132 RepID=UPI000869141B|nr:pyridoxal-5'-phosphate-dependent protein [Rhodobacteraceae bacterium (ex Bugula neritina AB1)]